jgi:hypothetical protein
LSAISFALLLLTPRIVFLNSCASLGQINSAVLMKNTQINYYYYYYYYFLTFGLIAVRSANAEFC